MLFDDMTGTDLQELWTISSAFGAENEDVRHLQQAIAGIGATPDAVRVRRRSDEIEAGLERLLEPATPDPAPFVQLAAACALVEEHDRRFLVRLKLTIRATRIMRELPGYGMLVMLNEEPFESSATTQTPPE